MNNNIYTKRYNLGHYQYILTVIQHKDNRIYGEVEMFDNRGSCIAEGIVITPENIESFEDMIKIIKKENRID